MRHFIFILCFLPLKMMGAISQSEAEQLAHQGDQFFSEKKYDEAIESYLQALQFHPSAQIYFNIGQSYALLNRPGFGLAYYLKAKRWNPHWELLQQELNRLYSENPNLSPVVNPWYRQWFTLFSWETWSWVCSFCFWIALWLFLYVKFQHKAKKCYVFPSFLLVLTCGILTLLGLNRSFNTLCLLPENTTAHFAPTDSSPVRYQWGMGTQCQIQNEREEYFFVNTKNNEDGWVKKQALIPIH